jgi:hypothetical protein
VFPLPDITVEAHALGNLRGRAETLDLLADFPAVSHESFVREGSFWRLLEVPGVTLAVSAHWLVVLFFEVARN